MQIYERVDDVWVKLYDFDCPEGMEVSAVTNIIWHPWLRHDLIIAEENGVLHIASFRDEAGPVGFLALIKSYHQLNVPLILSKKELWPCQITKRD